MKIRHNEENSTSGLHNTMTAGTNVAGNITTDTDFRLDGHVTGDVTCKGKMRSRARSKGISPSPRNWY